MRGKVGRRSVSEGDRVRGYAMPLTRLAPAVARHPLPV